MREIRHLMFSDRELLDLALLFLAIHNVRPDLVGPVWELATGDDGVRLMLHYGSCADRRCITLGEADLLSAAILFCRRWRVPLPTYGQKRLQLSEGALTLVVAMRVSDRT